MISARPPHILRTVAVLLVLLTAFGCSSSGGKHKARKRTVLLTEYDDARVGAEASESVAADMGLIEDPKLTRYVSDIGFKLLRGVPRRGFEYQFSVVDMLEPNAFALPGGYIFISRGLLALANDEDELACVIGHEITHAAHRHAAAQQALDKRINPLAMPWNRAAKMAGYSREMERDADEGGQLLCAAAGYDPMGMSTFLKNLGQAERLKVGYGRSSSFFDTHPGTSERAAANAVRAREIRWKRDPALGDPRLSLLRAIDGLEVGQRPEVGLFVGDVFIHPILDFKLRFPSGWDKVNTNRAVGAAEPSGVAVVFLTADVAPGELPQVADDWIAKQREQVNLRVTGSKPVKVGRIDAWRMEIEAPGMVGMVTFVPYGESTWRITGAASSLRGKAQLSRTLVTARSFQPLAPGDTEDIRSERLRSVEARPGEGFEALGQRSGNAWDVASTAVYNGLFVDHRFEGGEWVKIARLELWVPPAKK